MKTTLKIYLIIGSFIYLCLGCTSIDKKQLKNEGHCIFIDLEMSNKRNENFLLHTNNDTSYLHIYAYKERFESINDFEKEVMHVISNKEIKPYVFDLPIFIDINDGTIINEVDKNIFSLIRRKIIENKTSFSSLEHNSDFCYGIGLIDTQDSLFYLFEKREDALDLFNEINIILMRNNYESVALELKKEIIDSL